MVTSEVDPPRPDAIARAPSAEEVINLLPVPMLVANSGGTIEAINSLAAELLGPSAVPGRPLAKVIEGLGRSVTQWVEATASGRSTGQAEVLRIIDNEAERFVQVTMRRLPQPEGETPREPQVLLAMHDATDLKSLEAQFVQAQKMQAIGQLAGGIAHDFNNLLTAISGHCDLLLLRTSPGEESYEDLVQINQNAHRAAALVGQLLAFSRKQTMLPEQLDLAGAMTEVGVLLNRLVGARIRLEMSTEEHTPRIRADKRQIEQMLMNLVVNARDAMPDGGTIAVRASAEVLIRPLRRNRVSVPAGSYVRLTVADEGVGIAPSRIDKVFEPFYTTKRVGEGTGLGLSTVYGIVKQSGGYVFVDSEVGKGTTFTVYFPSMEPVKEVVAKPPEPAAPPPREDRSIRVLLVEDEAPVRAFAARALELGGMEVHQCASGEEALEVVGDTSVEPFDLYVSDVVMPGLDGPGWVVKALEIHPNTPVVFMSGYTQETFAEHQARIERSCFLAKPFSLADLSRAVRAQTGLPPTQKG